MDIKIIGSRVKNLLSYDWVKIVFSIVAGIGVWSLLFTTLGTRITLGQEFHFYTYENVSTAGSDKNIEILNKVKNKGYFSYDVLQLSPNSVIGGGQYSASYMLSLKMSTHEGDVIIISDDRADTDNTKKGVEITSMINSCNMFEIPTLLSKARDYCVSNGFVIEEGESWKLDEGVIKSHFLDTRLKSAGNYKKTYRTAQQKEEGAKNEVTRIKTLYENYLYVSRAIEKAKLAGNDFLWYGTLYSYDINGNAIEDSAEVKPLGIDLYKLNQPFIESGVPSIEETWFTYANGKPTSEGLVACVFNFSSYQADLQYETLGFLRYLIETYSRY